MNAAETPPRKDTDVTATLARIRNACCHYSGLSFDEWENHVRSVTATVLEARVRGRLVTREVWRLH